MNRHLGLDLESFGQHREGLYKLITECTVTRHNVLDLGMEQPIDGSSYQRITKIVEWTLILCKISGRQTISHNHICLMLQYLVHHLSGELCRIGIISIRHHIDFRINLAEHAADHVSLSLHILMADHSSGLLCQLYRPIR